MSAYSPFEAQLSQLRTEHLQVLRRVAEGWHVEYKSLLPNARALAKSISAFANTYGGWLFLGIEEKAKSDPVAECFPGLSSETVDRRAQRIRDAVAAHLNPIPFFDVRILRGPSAELGLAEGRAIIAIEVPESVTAPHIHSDGRIYRRVADGSEPKPETDRALLDQLRGRSEPTRKMVCDWVKRDPEFSEVESSAPYLRLLLCPDAWFRHRPERLLSLSEVRNALSSSPFSVVNAPFDTIYTAGSHIIARQIAGNDPRLYGLTWRIGPSMACDCVIPLPAFNGGFDGLADFLDGYENAARFSCVLRGAGYLEPGVVDLNLIASLLESCVTQYRRLLAVAGLPVDRFHYKMRILNAWRMCAFVDHSAVLDSYEEHGIPLLLEATSTFPVGDGPGSFGQAPTSRKGDFDLQESGLRETLTRYNADVRESDVEEMLTVKLQAAILCEYLQRMFGVPSVGSTEDGTKEEVRILYFELLELRERALRVQVRRGTRP